MNHSLVRALVAVGRELGKPSGVATLLDRVLAIAQEAFDYSNAIIRLLHEDGGLHSVAAYGYPEEARRRVILVNEGIIGRVAATGTPLLVGDVLLEPSYIPGIEGARCELAVPLLGADRVLGVLNIEHHQPYVFCDEDIEALTLFAGQVAAALENHRLFDELRSLNDRYRTQSALTSSIIHNVNVGIYTLDRNLLITSWNPEMERLSGCPASEVVGGRADELFPNIAREGALELIRQALENGEPASADLTHTDKNGERHFQRRRVDPLREDGEVTGCVVLIEDVTENRRLFEQLVQNEKLVDLGRLATGIAHEINNPLSVIGYAAKLLGDRDDMPSLEQELVDRIIQETGRLGTLTGGLLTFSRPGEMVRRLVEIPVLTADTLALVDFECRRDQVEVEVCFHQIAAVEGDPNRLKQVLLNLIKNARQAMGGAGKIRISGENRGGMVCLKVTDSGPGVPSGAVTKLFEPFYTTKPEGEGTGLGLYLCRKILLEHGGDLRYCDGEGGGAVFEIWLPAYEVHSAAAEQSCLL